MAGINCNIIDVRGVRLGYMASLAGFSMPTVLVHSPDQKFGVSYKRAKYVAIINHSKTVLFLHNKLWNDEYNLSLDNHLFIKIYDEARSESDIVAWAILRCFWIEVRIGWACEHFKKNEFFLLLCESCHLRCIWTGGRIGWPIIWIYFK